MHAIKLTRPNIILQTTTRIATNLKFLITLFTPAIIKRHAYLIFKQFHFYRMIIVIPSYNYKRFKLYIACKRYIKYYFWVAVGVREFSFLLALVVIFEHFSACAFY